MGREVLGEALVASRTFYRRASSSTYVLVCQIPAFRMEGTCHAKTAQTILLSASVTLVMVLTTHLREESARANHGELHGVAAVLQIDHSGRITKETNFLKNKFPQFPHMREGYRRERKLLPQRCSAQLKMIK